MTRYGMVIDLNACTGWRACQARYVYEAEDVKKAEEIYGEGPKAAAVDS